MEMKDKEPAQQSQNNLISKALVAAQSQMGKAVKDVENPFFKKKYADLNAVLEACLPALHAEKVAVLQPTVIMNGRMYVQTCLLHESGQSFTSLTDVRSVKENDPQAMGSAVSYARRYGLQSLLCIGVEDDDGNNASGKTNTNQPARSQAQQQTTSKPEPQTKASLPPANKSKPADAKAPPQGGTEKKQKAWIIPFGSLKGKNIYTLPHGTIDEHAMKLQGELTAKGHGMTAKLKASINEYLEIASEILA